MCKCLKVSRNAYYNWKRKKAETAAIQSKVEQLKNRIKETWEDSRKLYGSPKITEMLRREGMHYSVSYVARLMGEMGIKSLAKRKYVATTDSGHSCPVCENLLNRQFEVNQLGKVWVSGMTYVRCGQSWLYLTSMIDLEGGGLVTKWGHGHGKHRICRMAQCQKEQGHLGRLHHAGVQYAAHRTSNLFLFSSKMNQSMTATAAGRKGNCWDNAVAESFFKTIKCELIYLQKWSSFEQVFNAVEEYIYWYNTKMVHQGLGCLTPLEKEQLLRNMFHKQAA